MRFASLAMAISFASLVPASAQQEPPEGCFCLADSNQALPQVQRGCRREKFPNQYYWRGICRYVDGSGELVVAPAITISEDWRILLPDHPNCAACEPAARETDPVPRGEDDDEATE